MKSTMLTISVILSLSINTQLQSQNFQIEGDLLGGRIFKHKKELFFDVPTISLGAELTISKTTSGEKGWKQFWGRPDTELNLLCVNFGDAKVLGSAWAITPGLAFYLHRGVNSNLKLHLSTGVAYLTKTYDVNTNTNNNAIGSHINNATRFKLSYERILHKGLSVIPSISFNHFSNGRTTVPNSGINVVMLQMGLKKAFIQERNDEEKRDALSNTRNDRKWGINLQYSQGWSEAMVPGGPEFPVRSYGLSTRYKPATFLSLHGGGEYEYNEAIYEFERHIFTDKKSAGDKSTFYSVFVAAEMFFGSISQRVQLGYYLDTPIRRDTEEFYFKLNTNYYLSYISIGGVKPYIGIVLKSHYAVASYFAFVGGVDF